ncbi:hypothetical protein GIB67_023814, partial [Kingdonia uniflora]
MSFNNLQTLWGVLVPQGTSVANLNQCINLQKLGMEGDLSSHVKELTGWLSRLDRLESLKLCSTVGDLLPSELPSSLAVVEQSHALPALILFEKVHLVKLLLEGRLERLFIPRDFPPNLTTLTLVGSRLEDYSIKVLIILSNLKTLKLWYNSYMGNSMVCYSDNFLKLKVLELCWLRIQILDIHEGSMRNLKKLEINKCEYFRELPSGLQFLNHLKELRLPAMSDHLKERVLPNTGADWYKIAHIPFMRPPLNRWAEMFPCMIARTSTAEVISGGVGGMKNGALQLKDHQAIDILLAEIDIYMSFSHSNTAREERLSMLFVKNWYYLAKTTAESDALEYAKENKLDVVTVCPSFVIGPILQSTENLSNLMLITILR